MVDVSSQSNKVNITVSSSGVSSNVNASGDTTMYYSNKAREWAISNRIVDGVDYSSKYYAGRANQSALNAQSFAQSAQDSYNNFQQSVDGALSNIDSSVQGAIDDINNAKTDIITDIEFVADGAKEEIEDLVGTGKDELKEVIGDVKVLTTLDIGDIGIAPLGIDETQGKRRYLNGQLIIQDHYAQFTNKVKSAVVLYPSLACTESEWQATALLTVGGQVGKFVVDDEAGTIRLPKIIMPIQGLTDLSKLGEIVSAGLPNITGSTSYRSDLTSGAFGKYQGTAYGLGASSSSSNCINFDASRSNSIYSKSNTVQQEQIQYPYFIQVATGAETEDNIINEIELNNPYSLGDSKYSPIALNNLSWLKSEGQWNSEAVYPSFYDWALINLNNGVEGFALSTGEYTDYDVVINPADETFRLPLLNGSEDLVSDRYIDLTLGASSGSTYTAPANGWFALAKECSNGEYIFIGQGEKVSTQVWGAGAGYVQSYLPVLKGKEVRVGYTASGATAFFKFIYAKGNGSLYYYVGETVQNANLINAGRIEEKIADKVDTNASNFTADGKSLISSYAMPSNKYIDLTLGASGSTYTAPANGYICLGGVSTANFAWVTLVSNSKVRNQSNAYASGNRTNTFIPVKKGETFKAQYNNINSADFKFIYAEGDQ